MLDEETEVKEKKDIRKEETIIKEENDIRKEEFVLYSDTVLAGPSVKVFDTKRVRDF